MNIRPAAVAGTWYPGTAPALAAAVDRHLAAADRAGQQVRRRSRRGHRAARRADLLGPGRRARVPAAPRSRVRRGRPRGPVAFCRFRGRRRSTRRAASRRRSAWRRSMPTARARSPARRQSSSTIGAAHAREHSLEMQLPFLAHLAPGLPIVPLVMGYQTTETAYALGDALATALRGRKALLVASTDLSHYHDAATAARARRGRHRPRVALRRRRPAARARRPAGSRVRRRADGRRHARRAARSARATRWSSTTRIRATSPATSRRSLATLRRPWDIHQAMRLQTSDCRVQISQSEIRICNLRSAIASTIVISVCMTSDLDRALLLRLAREALAAHVGVAPAHGPAPSEVLDRPGGAFVSLHNRGELRGCIGHIEATEPLGKVVRALRRRRRQRPTRAFPPSRGELDAARHRALAARTARTDRRPAGDRHRTPRARRGDGMAPRSAAATGGHRVELGRGDVPRPHLPQSRPAARRLETGREDLAIRG